MATVLVHGSLDKEKRSELERGLPAGTVTVKHAVRVQAARGAAPPLPLEGVAPDDILEVELEDGIRLWMRVEDAARELGVRPRGSARGGAGVTTSAGAAADVIELPSTLPTRVRSRGVMGQFAIKALKVLGIDIAETITSFAADKVERRLTPGPGLYRCSDAKPDGLTEIASPLDASGPILVFVHGTASSTAGAFAGLWSAPDPVMTQLVRRYDGRVLAFQHETLTKSPIENAQALVARLREVAPAGTELHLVAHSRGGLVGELIARGGRVGAAPFTADEIALFSEPARARDHAAIQALGTELEKGAFRLTKFVRVAAPARGTTLADGRLDRYFSILTNIVGWIPGLRGTGVYDGLTALLAGVLKQRTQPEELPGLEAMMPGSPLIRILNNDRVTLSGDLHVLGGDLEGEGLLGRLKTLATDAFFREDHDLVVNTVAMLGGAARTQPVRYWIDTGDKVTHFSYFSRADTSRRLAAALTGFEGDFHTLDVKPSAVTAKDYRKRALVEQPRLVIVPGLMGSELTVNGARVWIDRAALAEDGWERLASAPIRTDEGTGGVEATGILASAYGDLCRHLAATHDVKPFAYDWRQALDASAARLRESLDALLEQTEAQPIRILAHSTGGLVLRAMLTTDEGKATWKAMTRHAGARVLLLGVPFDGAYGIANLLLGHDPLIGSLALLGLRSRDLAVRQALASFEGILGALPEGVEGTEAAGPAQMPNLLERRSWELLPGVDVDVPAATLKRARDLRKKMAKVTFDRSRVVHIGGAAAETPCGYRVDDGVLQVMASSHGDGRALWAHASGTSGGGTNGGGAIAGDLNGFILDAPHGNLCNTEGAFAAILDLLSTGTTTRLPRAAARLDAARPDVVSPDARTNDAGVNDAGVNGARVDSAFAAFGDIFPARSVRPQMLPDEEELVVAALAGTRVRVRADDHGPRVRVRVVHDDLKNAVAPVLVGHYVQDLIVGTEAYLNQRLSGRLAELHRMDLYPGPVGTSVPVLNEAEAERGWHPGAIVAGLGRVGELTAGGLMGTLAQALTTYGAECVGRERRRRRRERLEGGLPSRVSAPVTAVLVGSGDGGLTVENSVQAILRAVAAANERLRRPAKSAEAQGGREPLWAQVDQVDILELYEDKAINAAYALRNLSRSPELADFVITDVLVSSPDGRRRPSSGASAEWWQRVRVTRRQGGRLRFEALTQTARATATLQPVERRAVERFVAQALGTTSGDRAIGETLFELLVPNAFKANAPDRRKLVLVMDEESAALPWELMQDRYETDGKPMSVASGMVRQLLLKDVPAAAAARALSNTALVIGDPIVLDDRFPRLPAAAEEAAAVADRLAAERYVVTRLIGDQAGPSDVVATLLRSDWRILHLAGHGVFEFTPDDGGDPVSGLVLDDGQFVTPAIAGQMRVVPEVVFLNCCHLGNTAGEARKRPFHKLAANLGTAFIRMGARAVIAAGWAVNDAAAKTFAHAFYDEMFAGNVFGDAVLRARERTYAAYPESNSWGAYQCYGDPSFALTTVQPGSTQGGPVAAAELIAWAEDLAARAGGVGDDGRAALRAGLRERLAAAPPEWLEDPRVCAAVASAFGELAAYREALDFSDRLTRFERADLSVRTIEQLANFRVRYAGDREIGAREAASQLEKARTLLTHLLAIGETVERLTLLGGLEKRAARLARGAARQTALEAMREACARAYVLALERPGGAAAYPLVNLLAAEIPLEWRNGHGAARARRTIAEHLARLQDLARELTQGSTRFFELIHELDHLLLEGLAAKRPAVPDEATLRIAYSRAAHRGVSPRERESIVSQIEFLAAMADPDECPGLPEDLRPALTSLAETLRKGPAAP